MEETKKESIHNESHIPQALPSVIHTRCPSCEKLFEVQSSLINDELAHFQCVSCKNHFYFASELIKDGMVQSFPLDLSSLQGLGDLDFVNRSVEAQVNQELFALNDKAFVQPEPRKMEAPEIEATKICPKCQSVNRVSASDCEVCGVDFKKIEMLQKDGHHFHKISRTLHDQWQYVLSHYDDMTAHQKFLTLCLGKGHLTLGARSYQKVLQVLPADETATLMLKQIAAVTEVPFELVRSNKKSLSFWRTHMFSLVFAVAGLIIMSGFIFPQSRNLVGAGVAILVVAYGVKSLLNETR